MPGRDVLARTWFEQARADLAAAEDSTATGHHEWACFQAQQAGGEGVKAFSTPAGVPTLFRAIAVEGLRLA